MALNNIFQPVPLTLLATLLVGLILFVKNVKGNFLLTIIFGVLISIALGVTDISSFSYSFIDLVPWSRLSSNLIFRAFCRWTTGLPYFLF